MKNNNTGQIAETKESFSILFNEKELINEIKNCKIANFQDNTQLLSEGSYVKVVPVVLSGKINVIRNDESDKQILLYSINQMESCALSISACFSNEKSKAVAITEGDTTAILISSDKIREWMTKYPSWGKFVLKLHNQRLIEIIDVVDAIAFRNIDYRLIEFLKKKQKTTNSNIIYITHEQLSRNLGTVREVISRILKQMENSKKIVNHRGRIEIIDLM